MAFLFLRSSDERATRGTATDQGDGRADAAEAQTGRNQSTASAARSGHGVDRRARVRTRRVAGAWCWVLGAHPAPAPQHLAPSTQHPSRVSIALHGGGEMKK